MMQITRTSMLTGITRTVDMPVTLEQLQQYEMGEQPIQRLMPNLDDNQREFIMTGITEDEWDNLFSNQEDYDLDDDEPAF